MMRELTRRHWMLLAASIAVQSCGGGDGDNKGGSSSSGAGGSNFDRYSVTLPQSIAANETKVSIDDDEYLLDELPNGLGEVLPAVLLAHQGEDIVYFAMPSDNNQEVEVNSLSTAIGLLKHIPEIALLVKTDSNSDFALGQNSNVIALAQYIDNLIEEHGAAWMSVDNQELAEKIATTAKSVVKTLNSASAAFSSGLQILNDDVSETHFARIESDDFYSNGAISSTFIEAQVLDDEFAQFYQVQDFDREQDKLAVVISDGAYRHISVIVRKDLSETGDVLDFTTLKPHVSQDNQFGESSEPTYGVFGGLLLSPGQFGQMVFNQEHLPDGIENGHYYIQAFGLGFHDTPLNRSEVKYAFEPVLIDSFNLFVEPLLGLYQKSKKLNQTNQTLQDINFDQLKLSDVYLTEETCNEIDKTKLQYEIVKSLIAKMNTLENQTLVLEQKYFRLSHNLIETLIDAINDNSSEFIRNNVSKCALAWFEANFTKRAQSLLAKRVLPVIGQALLFYDAVTASESLAQSSGVIWDVSRKEEWLLNFEFSHCVMQNRLNQYYEDDTYCYSVYQDEGDGRVYAQQYHHGLLAAEASFEPGNRSLTSEYPAIPVDFYSEIKVGKKEYWATYSTSIDTPRYSVPMESHTNFSGNENSEGYTEDRSFSEPLKDLNGEWHSLLQKKQYKSESAERTNIYYPEARYDLYGTPLSIISESQSYDPVTDTFSRQLFSEPVQDKNEHWIALLNYTETQHPSYDSFTRYAPAQDNDGQWKAHTLEYQHRSFTQNSEHHDEYFHQLQQNHDGQWVSLLHRSRVINQRGENLRENYEPTQDSDGNWHAHPKEKRTRSIHGSAETESLERYYPPEQDNKGYYSSSLEVKTYSSSSSRSKTQYSAPKQLSADRFDSYPIYSESFNGARAVITHYYPAEVGSNGEVYSLCEEVVDYYDFDNGGIRTRTDCGAPVARDGGYVNSQRVVTYYCFPYTGRVSSRATYRADGSSNSSEPNDCD